MNPPSPRERFIVALERRRLSGHVPHFELFFYLTMEAFGKVHPLHRDYHQWLQMEEGERQLHRCDMADLYIATAERYEHSAIFVHRCHPVTGPGGRPLRGKARRQTLLAGCHHRNGCHFCAGGCNAYQFRI